MIKGTWTALGKRLDAMEERKEGLFQELFSLVETQEATAKLLAFRAAAARRQRNHRSKVLKSERSA